MWQAYRSDRRNKKFTHNFEKGIIWEVYAWKTEEMGRNYYDGPQRNWL
jgi:hypothetical protein